ncbi:MAG: PQQ-dependent sugar dehydrogenase [Candidatus Kaiserbacteria bacterium]|nr:MAG: PQQ-dependent sugar dehydrogenase [Candidatus Kaiserbacteria bacterium]
MKKAAIILIGVLILGLIAYASPLRGFLSGLLPLVRPAPPLPPAGEPLPFSVPEGFAAYRYADNLPGIRVLTRAPGAAFYASLTSEGKIVALLDEDGDWVAEKSETVLEGLQRPHGLFVDCDENDANCTMYVAEENAVNAYRFDPATRTASEQRTLATLPAGGGHFTRTLLPHPDGKRLLVSIGSSCNVCEESDSRRASVQAIDLATGAMSPFATGLRNTVFMQIHPVSGEIWGTDMGRDLLGDDTPPDEINVLREGGWYGWPWFYGKNTVDESFGSGAPAADPSPSMIDVPAHSAPLGIAFVPEEGWPEEYWYDALVAYHGSWNRSVPTGYKVVRFPLDAQGKPEGDPQDFLTGFTAGGSVIGRPVDVLAEPGGTVYITDDRAGAVYRVSRTSI